MASASRITSIGRMSRERELAAAVSICGEDVEGCLAQNDDRRLARPVIRWAASWARALGYQLVPINENHQVVGHSGREIVQRRIQQYLEQGEHEAIVVMRIDVDDLDRVNEAISLAAGDHVLDAVARRIEHVIGNVDDVARISGVSFLAIMPSGSEIMDAELGQSIRRAAADPVLASGHVIQPTVSIGIAYATSEVPAEQAVQNATLAVRRAREAGGDQAAFAADGLVNTAMEQLRLEEALRRALAVDEVRAWFQPIVNLEDGRTCGYEALSRWITSGGDCVTPCTFIPLAESVGLIIEIDLLVLSQALDLLASFEHEFVSVNVSPVSLANREFVSRARALLSLTKADLRRLHLEVTETSLPKDLGLIRQAMLALSEGGAKWYFDDFGTGFSSLSHLGELPVHGLKLDMSFTRGIDGGDDTSVRLAQGLLSLARGLELDTIAEGVESARVAAILHAQGWHRAQGWLYGKAQPLSQF